MPAGWDGRAWPALARGDGARTGLQPPGRASAPRGRGVAADGAPPPPLPPLLQAGKVVILLTGRYAGKKAVIVKNNDDGTSSRPYGHALVCGLSKEPRKVRVGQHMEATCSGGLLARSVGGHPRRWGRDGRDSRGAVLTCPPARAPRRPAPGHQAVLPEGPGQALHGQDLHQGRQLPAHDAHPLHAGGGPQGRRHQRVHRQQHQARRGQQGAGGEECGGCGG